MRRGFQRIFIFIGIMAALGLCGCGKKETPVREVDPEDIKVLREFFVYDGIGFYADGLKWSDSWEDVKESRGIENADVRRRLASSIFWRSDASAAASWASACANARAKWAGSMR